jgi:hypothetical protein
MAKNPGPGATSNTQAPAGNRSAADFASRRKSSMSFRLVEAYQRAIHPSIPVPFQGFGCAVGMT